MIGKIYHSDNILVLKQLESEFIDLIYIDPPFNTGKRQKRDRIRTRQSKSGNRKGFQERSKI